MRQMNRLDVFLQAEVVCATLSGSGSHTLVEAVMLSAQVAAQVSGRAKPSTRKWGGSRGLKMDIPGGALSFDAVVMVRAVFVRRVGLVSLVFQCACVCVCHKCLPSCGKIRSKFAREFWLHQP